MELFGCPGEVTPLEWMLEDLDLGKEGERRRGELRRELFRGEFGLPVAVVEEEEEGGGLGEGSGDVDSPLPLFSACLVLVNL